MDRNQAKELLPVIKAFSEGKDIETKTGSGWISIENMSFAGNPDSYRIKLEPRYRPFKGAEECWNEMQKHQPFGWVKDKYSFYPIAMITANFSKECIKCYGTWFTPEEMFKDSTFLDGTPFGVKI